MLIKPTRKQILTAAALKARAAIEAQIDEKRDQQRKLKAEDEKRISDSRTKLQERVASKYQPAIDEMEAVLAKHGLSAKVNLSSDLPSTTGQHDTVWRVTKLTVSVYSDIKLARAFTEPVPKRRNDEAISELQAEINELNDQRTALDPNTVMFDIIAANLNGELSAALDTLTTGLKDSKVDVTATETALAAQNDHAFKYSRRY